MSELEREAREEREARSTDAEMDPGTVDPRDIAVIGLGGRFPGAPDIPSFWRLLANGEEAIRRFSREELADAGVPSSLLDHPSYVRASAFLDGIEEFDASFFGFTRREAEVLDPQHRLFLEIAWEALEDAGHDPDRSPALVGVFVGVGNNPYGWRLLDSDDPRAHALGSYQVILANSKDQLPTKISYKLNLRGPSLAVQCACSSSLVAAHLACQSLIGYECDLALAGGVSISLLAKGGYLFERGGILSPDGHCRAFDARAAGTVPGAGAGCVVLKRLDEALQDGDRVDAVIKGSAINNDGAFKMGYTAPSIDGQAEVIASALAVASMPPESITLLEGHGTGTAVGDPIETTALRQVFGETDEPGYCALGSVKTNLGHLDTAAGITGLIKAVLALREQKIPPSLHFTTPHPGCDFKDGPFRVPTSLEPWPAGSFPRRAGVSSFGIGGTNVHMILQEAPASAARPTGAGPWTWVLSAPTASALETTRDRLHRHLEERPNLDPGDIAATLYLGRKRFAHRRALVVESLASARQLLEAGGGEGCFGAISSIERPRVVFLFPGQGAQHPGMGMALYNREPVFRQVFDRIADGFRPLLGLDLRQLLLEETEETEKTAELRRTDRAQPALFAVEFALAQLWRSWGVEPSALLGHSIGELVAACLAGVFDLEDALRLVAERGRLMQTLQAGAMLAVPLPIAELEARLERRGAELDIAAINAPDLGTVSGPPGAVASFATSLEEEGIAVRRLHTDRAFHSAMTEPIAETLAQFCRQIPLSPPRIPFLSGVTGRFIRSEEATDPEYWIRQLRQPVRFADGCTLLLEDTEHVFLEVGPSQTAAALLRRQTTVGERRAITSLARPRQPREADLPHLLGAVARLWLAGVDLDVEALAGPDRRRVSLPTYPFERQRYWIEAGTGRATNSRPRSVPEIALENDTVSPAQRPGDDLEQRLASILQELLGLSTLDRHEDFFDLGGSSLLAIRLLARLEEAFGTAPPLETLLAGASLASLTDLLRDATARPSSHPAKQLSAPSLLITLQPEGKAEPMFWVHPIGGSAHLYRPLARAMKRRPFHAFQAPGLGGGEAMRSIPELAAQHLEALRRHPAQGPYLLGGWSFGGLVAFEMCRQLAEQGAAVEHLILLDSWPTPANPASNFDELALMSGLLHDLAHSAQIDLRDVDLELRDGFEEQLPLQGLNRLDRLSRLSRLDQIDQIDLGVDETQLRRLLDLYRAHMEAVLSYEPKPIAVPTLLVQAEEDRGAAPTTDEVLTAWSELTADHLTARTLPTSHHRLLIEPHVSTVGEWLEFHFQTKALHGSETDPKESEPSVVVPTALPSPTDAAARDRGVTSTFSERGIRHES